MYLAVFHDSDDYLVVFRFCGPDRQGENTRPSGDSLGKKTPRHGSLITATFGEFSVSWGLNVRPVISCRPIVEKNPVPTLL